MMPPSSIHHCSNVRHSCWLSAGTAQAHIGALDSPAAASPIPSRYAQITRSYQRIHPCFAADQSRQPLNAVPQMPSFVAKSP